MLAFIYGGFIERYVSLPPCLYVDYIYIESPQNKKQMDKKGRGD